MATTAYERFLKDPDKEEAVNIEIKDQKPLDLDQIKQKIQTELAVQTKPKKPVKWLAMPDPKSILELYYTLSPNKVLGQAITQISGGKIPLGSMEQIKALPDAPAPRFKIGNKEITQERDYTTEDEDSSYVEMNVQIFRYGKYIFTM